MSLARRGPVPAAAVLLLGLLGCLLAARLWPGGMVAWVLDCLRNVQQYGGLGWLGVAMLQTLVAVSGILPASLVGTAAGAACGVLAGFALASTGTLLGAVLAFVLGRSVFRPLVLRLLAGRPRLRNLDALIARDGWRTVCLLRISPIMPFAATSYALGLTSVGFADYMLGTLASLPALFGYVLLGRLAAQGMTAWSLGAGPGRWAVLALGVLATAVLTLRVGQLARRAGLVAEDDAALLALAE